MTLCSHAEGITNVGGSLQKRFPDLFCIGAQKAATTWLYENLRKRPEFYVPVFKELHYFTQLHQPELNYTRQFRADRAARIAQNTLATPGNDIAAKRAEDASFLAQPEIDDDWYGTVFGQASTDQVCVDTCPSYLHLPEAGIRHLLRLNPLAKLLVIVRDPVDRAWSHIRMHIKQGIELPEVDVALGRLRHMRRYLANSEYQVSMTLWRSLCAPGQLSVMLYDEVAANPQSAFLRVYGIVGLPAPSKLRAVDEEVHKGWEMELPKALRASLVAKLAPQYDFLAAEFPDAVAAWRAKHDAAMAR